MTFLWGDRSTPATRNYRTDIAIYDSEKFTELKAQTEAIGYFNGYRIALKKFAFLCEEVERFAPLVPTDYWFFVVRLPNFNTGMAQHKVMSGAKSAKSLMTIFLQWAVAELRNAFEANGTFSTNAEEARKLFDATIELGFFIDSEKPQQLLLRVYDLLEELEKLHSAV